MNPEHPNLETELRGLRARALDEDLLQRLEACAEGTYARPTPEELRFEAELRVTRPAPLEPAFLADLEKIFHEVPFPVDEKIVLFPKGAPAAARSPKRQRPMWAAAAAVALIGAASALMMPANKPAAGRLASNLPAAPAPVAVASAPSNIAPASFNRGVSEVNDEGVVWKDDNQPHNVVRVVFQDKITMKDKNGRTYQVERPRVQYMLVPAHTD